VDEIEFGGADGRLRRPVAIGVGMVLVVVVGLAIWQRHPAKPQPPAPIAHTSPTPNVCVCGEETSTVNDTTRAFHQGFLVKNFGNAPATVTQIAAETPASFHQIAVGLLVTSDANEVGQSNITLLSTYTMPPQSSAYLVVTGTVTCPATDVDPNPRVSLKVDGTAMSFETPGAMYGSWEADVAEGACGP